MSPKHITEINHTIAKNCHLGSLIGTSDEDKIPDFWNSLDACQFFVLTLKIGNLITYTGFLYRMAGADVTASAANYCRGSYPDAEKAVLYNAGKTHLASSEYRCEAFLRTLNLWKEEWK